VPDDNESIDPWPLDPEPTAILIFPATLDAVPVDTKMDPVQPALATPDESVKEPVNEAVGDDPDPTDTAPE